MNIEKLLADYPLIRIAFIETNIFSIIILIIILFTRNLNRFKTPKMSDQSFNRLIITTIFVMLFDSCMWLFNGRTGIVNKLFNVFFSTFCYIVTPIASYFAIEYMHNKSFANEKKRNMINLIFLIPIILSTLIALINLKSGWIFTINENNVYERGPIFFIFTIIPFIYLTYISVLALILAKKQTYKPAKRDFKISASFVIPAYIGGILQTITGLSITWAGVTISIFVLYVTVQNSQLLTDSLTGVGNRRSYEISLSEYSNYAESSGRLYALMLDVDCFKNINDKYGHHIGDSVLVDLGRMLGQVCYEKNASVFRYGGDEFAILGISNTPNAVISEILVKITDLASRYNQEIKSRPQLSLSFGYAIYNSQIDKNAEGFMSRADKAMYIEKEKKRS